MMGGSADAIAQTLEEQYATGLGLAAAVQLAVRALESDGAEPRQLGVGSLEVAILDRRRTQPRKFRRIVGPRLAELLAGSAEGTQP
ncbi:hypothetical protein GCM10027613_44490 [Microlunatus endophyticus]